MLALLRSFSLHVIQLSAPHLQVPLATYVVLGTLAFQLLLVGLLPVSHLLVLFLVLGYYVLVALSDGLRPLILLFALLVKSSALLLESGQFVE